MTGRKLGKWQKNSILGRKRSLLCKYIIYAPNVKTIYALKLVLETNGKFDRKKIQKSAILSLNFWGGGGRSKMNY